MNELEVLQQISTKLDTNTSAINDLFNRLDTIGMVIDEMKIFMVIIIGIVTLIFFYSKIKEFGGAFK